MTLQAGMGCLFRANSRHTSLSGGASGAWLCPSWQEAGRLCRAPDSVDVARPQGHRAHPVPRARPERAAE